MDHLQIDIANPADIQRQMPRIAALYNRKAQELQRLSSELQALGHLIDSLRAMAETPQIAGEASGNSGATVTVTSGGDATANGSAKAPARAVALDALRRAGRPMGPAALYRFMADEGMPVPANANALGATLWTAAKAGELVRTDDRRYALRPVTDYSKIPDEFPRPSARQAQLSAAEVDRE